jgi:hypothetical protein
LKNYKKILVIRIQYLKQATRPEMRKNENEENEK